MYFFLAVGLVTSSFAWYMAIESVFFLAIATTFAFMSYIHVKNLYYDTFLQQSIHCMVNTDCCCIHKIWSNPKSILWPTILFRTIAGTIAVLAVIISWARDQKFIHKHYFITQGMWTLASSAWLFSCTPFIISLIQCAAESDTNQPHSMNIQGKKLDIGEKLFADGKTITLASGKTIVVRFRKSIAIWLIHDIVSGIFWIYLSVLLYDLSDDEDDSHWRTIFLSMISWHIVFVTLHHLYMKKWWSALHVTQKIFKSKACCAPSEADKWWSILHLIGLVAIYVGVIQRMNEPDLMNMGCPTQTLILLVSGSIAFCVGKIMTKNVFAGNIVYAPNKQKYTIPHKYHTNTDHLDF